MKKALSFAILFLLAAGIALAQTSKGTLVGVARDRTGAAIPNATVSITDQSTGLVRHGRTGPDGAYRFDAIDPGPYMISVSDAGFLKFEAKNVQVLSTVVSSYDVTLLVGRSEDVVTVEADQASLNTENGQLAGVVGALEIDKLPIFSLNPVELALTVPGVQPVTQGNNTNGENIQVNGARPRANNFLLDGQEINDVGISGQAFQPQIPDIFSAVDVITNSASAEYGRAGGGIVNMVTKQGTNSFHGTLFERYNGSGLSSIPGNLRGSGQPNPRQVIHSYGFTAGGPILKNKLFAFGAWELQRTYGTEQASQNLLPDAAGYATLQTITGAAATQVALLDQYLSNGAYLNSDIVYGPATPGNSYVTSKNVGALPGCPASGCVITFAGFQRPSPALNSPDTQWMYRVDYTPWEKDSFSFRYLHDRSSLTPDFFTNGGALAGFDTFQGGPAELGEGTWTHVFTSQLLNEFRVSEARLNFQFAPTAETLANPLDALATISFGNLTGTSTAGSVSFPSLGPNQGYPQGRKEDLYQFQDTVSYTKGRQTFRIGADIGRLIEIDLVGQNAKGGLNFVDGGSGVSSLGNFLLNQLGPSGTATRAFGPTRVDSHGYRNGFFAQDDIKFSPDLTVNLGVRYDYLSNPENSLKYPGVDPNNPLAPIPTYVPIKNDYNNISPRIGFAYSPHGIFGKLGDGKTVIRGGFGIFYDSTFSNILTNSATAAPVAASGLLQLTTGNGLTNATSLIPTIPQQINQLSVVESEASNLVNPMTYQYNVGIERELPGTIVLSVRYVGNIGKDLFANQQYNVINGVTGLRPDTDRGQIILRGNYAASNYNGLEISGSHNFKNGLVIRTNYVYSKDLSNGDDIFSGTSSPTSYGVNLNPGYRYLEWGNSAFDHRQFFSVAYVYSPKGLHSENKFTNAALGAFTRHWTISGVTQLQSGEYDTVSTNGLDINGDGSSTNDRPIVGNPSAPLTAVGIDGIYLGPVVTANGTTINPVPGTIYNLNLNNTLAPSDPNSLTPVTSGQVHFIIPYGPANQYAARSIGRNSILQPGTTTNNVALEKGIGLSYLHFERGTFILRAEAQNIGNHNDNTIGSTNSLTAGQGFLDTARASTQRVLILWGKLQF